MQGAVVTAVAAAVLLAATYGLVEIEDRAGPIDTVLQPAAHDAHVEGTYEARSDSSVAGVCPAPPCDPFTAIDVRLDGLPPAPYTALLEGADRVALGPLVPDGDGHVLQWSADEDHTDKRRVLVRLAERTVAQFPVAPSDEPAPVATDLGVQWARTTAPVHLGEIGGVTISTVAKATLSEAPPAGWTFQARLEGDGGRVDLGPLGGEAGAVLDARVERVALEDQTRLVVTLHPDSAGAAGLEGFPAWTADLAGT